MDERVTALANTVAGLQKLPVELISLRQEVGVFRQELDSFRVEVNARFDRVDARFDTVERRMTEELEHLYARMRLLHENLIDRIRIGDERPRRRTACAGSPETRPQAVAKVAASERSAPLISHAAFRGRLHQADVFRQDAFGGLRRRRFPRRTARGEFGVAHIQANLAFRGVDRDVIAVAHETDGPAVNRFRRDVTDDEAM